MTRVWAYQRMNSDAPLAALTPGGIHASTKLEKTPHQKPFIMYRQTSDVSFMRGDDRDQCRRLGYMVFCHDVPGSYMQIDTLIDRLRFLFADVVDQPNSIIKSIYVETSDDLRDEDMGTIMKYARLEITYRLELT